MPANTSVTLKTPPLGRNRVRDLGLKPSGTYACDGRGARVLARGILHGIVVMVIMAAGIKLQAAEAKNLGGQA